MLNLFHVGEPLDKLVIERPQTVHETILFIRRFYSNDDLITPFPFMDELVNHVDGVLFTLPSKQR